MTLERSSKLKQQFALQLHELEKQRAQFWTRAKSATHSGSFRIEPEEEINRRHPLHLDFECRQCKPPFTSFSLSQKILASRPADSPSLDSPSQSSHFYVQHPFTEEELLDAYLFELCPHQEETLSKAEVDIKYQGELLKCQEALLIGAIIRSIVTETARRRAKRDVAIVPKTFLKAGANYDVDLYGGGKEVEQLYTLRGRTPARLLLVVPRRMELVDWACTKSVLVFLAARGWTIFVVQSPPLSTTSRTRYKETDDRLTALQWDLDGMRGDVALRIRIATATAYLQMTKAASRDPGVLFEWFGANRKDGQFTRL